MGIKIGIFQQVHTPENVQLNARVAELEKDLREAYALVERMRTAIAAKGIGFIEETSPVDWDRAIDAARRAENENNKQGDNNANSK